MWLKDDGGADIKGSVDVEDREGSIEIIGLSHGINLPVDSANGKITGTRQHSSMMIEKEVDSSTPYLYKAVLYLTLNCRATIKMNHVESISIQYEKITWRIVDGNIQHTDAWNERPTA